MKKKMAKFQLFFFSMFALVSNVYAAGTKCGANIIEIPNETIKILHTGYVLIQIAAPLLLVVMGLVDFGRAVVGSSEEDIKKKQKKFIKRMIAAALVFLVASIIRFVFGILARAKFIDARGCINAIINGVKK